MGSLHDPLDANLAAKLQTLSGVGRLMPAVFGDFATRLVSFVVDVRLFSKCTPSLFGDIAKAFDSKMFFVGIRMLSSHRQFCIACLLCGGCKDRCHA